MCNLYSITTNQAAIIALFRVINRYVGNLPPMPGVFPDYPAPVIRNAGTGREMTLMRWGMPPPLKSGGPPVTNIRNTSSPHWRGTRFSASAWFNPVRVATTLETYSRSLAFRSPPLRKLRVNRRTTSPRESD